jgi:tetratricopeptide (TPR) repeat protein
MNISKRITIFLLVCFIALPCIAHRHSGAYADILENTSDYTDAEKLSRAVEYFQSGKYHEALIWFSKLDKKYKLNPRFQAYMGVCCYYDGEYERAIEALEHLSELASYLLSIKADKQVSPLSGIDYFINAEPIAFSVEDLALLKKLKHLHVLSILK